MTELPAILLGLSALAFGKDAPDAPYVQSMQGGVFYARCIPEGSGHGRGTTTIYRVGRDADTPVDRYDWYASDCGVVLGWSPLAGKVAVMSTRIVPPRAGEDEHQVELSFYLGGQLLRSYTTSDLIRLGAEPRRLRDSSGRSQWRRAEFTPGECEQVPGTNTYVFTILVANDRRIAFDITTGLPRAE
jgi:hypothetical protein